MRGSLRRTNAVFALLAIPLLVRAGIEGVVWRKSEGRFTSFFGQYPEAYVALLMQEATPSGSKRQVLREVVFTSKTGLEAKERTGPRSATRSAPARCRAGCAFRASTARTSNGRAGMRALQLRKSGGRDGEDRLHYSARSNSSSAKVNCRQTSASGRLLRWRS